MALGRDVVDIFPIINVDINTCGVAVAIARIFLRGHVFESPWGHLCFSILATCGMYGGMRMRMGFSGREE
jgi:hypothetical protein